ncbi:hypothetical protein MycrhDRAFT_3395 [Mycolicibacterium rhodesiae JS60]|nr:hypothetical protein MycrhDRAFT_3395 [Mycolicibacterium rhodesiae JS60]
MSGYALGKFGRHVTGDIVPRQVQILVDWQSKAAFDSYCNDPALRIFIHTEKWFCRMYLASVRHLGRSAVNSPACLELIGHSWR